MSPRKSKPGPCCSKFNASTATDCSEWGSSKNHETSATDGTARIAPREGGAKGRYDDSSLSRRARRADGRIHVPLDRPGCAKDGGPAPRIRRPGRTGLDLH